jgi:hypothetical protein
LLAGLFAHFPQSVHGVDQVARRVPLYSHGDYVEGSQDTKEKLIDVRARQVGEGVADMTITVPQGARMTRQTGKEVRGVVGRTRKVGYLPRLIAAPVSGQVNDPEPVFIAGKQVAVCLLCRD